MKSRQWFALLLLLALCGGSTASAQTAEDYDKIKATALDYVEGWYEGNGERMRRSLHPDLVKRIVVGENGARRIQQMGAEQLVRGTASGIGKQTPRERQVKNVQVLDVFGNAAAVRAEMADWIDYMQIAKFDDRWLIVNVLWERKPSR